MAKYQKPMVVLLLCLVFSTLFLYNTKRDFPLIFKKDMLAHDESVNSVVAANVTRKFFPPMVRVNPLNEQQGIWMEGPQWQHIPPMFAYVPYLFFQLDGQVTIEIKRLSYAFLILLTGVLFIFSIYQYKKSLLATLAATIAAIFWINTPFTHELITGYAFGVSDIVLAFTAVLGFGGLLWYFLKEKNERIVYSWWKIGLMAVLVALPIMAKNLLGAIPAAIFFGSLLIDHKGLRIKVLTAGCFFGGALALYYLPLFLSSPETFQSEILISFFHVADYEGWGRPWHYYISNYLPQRYLFGWTWVYFIGLIGALTYYGLQSKTLSRIDRVLIGIPLLWFVWNLAAVSLVESKIANFIFQSYLLSLFAILYAVTHFVRNIILRRLAEGSYTRFFPPLSMTIAMGLIAAILVTGYEAKRFGQEFKNQRALAYNYQSEREKFFQAAELMQQSGFSEKDFVVVRVSENDCWARYPVLFLTGAESKTLLEMHFGFDEQVIKQKYTSLNFLVGKKGPFPNIDAHGVRMFGDYFLAQYDLKRLTEQQTRTVVQAFLDINNQQIMQDIERIKDDKTSCQWLVPDAILNAP